MREESRNVSEVTSAKRHEQDLEKLYKAKGPIEERNWASELHMAGRKAYYEEYFNGIKLEDQIIPAISSFSDPRTTHNFIEGYKRGKFLVEQGIIPEDYQKNSKPNHR